MLHRNKDRHLPQFMFQMSLTMKAILLVGCVLMVLIAGCSQQAEDVAENTSETVELNNYENT